MVVIGLQLNKDSTSIERHRQTKSAFKFVVTHVVKCMQKYIALYRISGSLPNFGFLSYSDDVDRYLGEEALHCLGYGERRRERRMRRVCYLNTYYLHAYTHTHIHEHAAQRMCVCGVDFHVNERGVAAVFVRSVDVCKFDP